MVEGVAFASHAHIAMWIWVNSHECRNNKARNRTVQRRILVWLERDEGAREEKVDYKP